MTFTPAAVNAGPGVVVRLGHQVVTVLALEVHDDTVTRIHAVGNPVSPTCADAVPAKRALERPLDAGGRLVGERSSRLRIGLTSSCGPCMGTGGARPGPPGE